MIVILKQNAQLKEVSSAMALHLYNSGALMKKPNFVDNVDYSKYTLKELRSMFPKIKASSKAKFIKALKDDIN